MKGMNVKIWLLLVVKWQRLHLCRQYLLCCDIPLWVLSQSYTSSKHTHCRVRSQHGSVELFVIVCWLRKQSHGCAGPSGMYDGTKAVVAVHWPTVRLYGLTVRSGIFCKCVDPRDFFPWPHNLPYSHYHEPQKILSVTLLQVKLWESHQSGVPSCRQANHPQNEV